MIDFTQIFTEFKELVGYRSENDISLPTSLTNSTSGLYVNDLAGVSLQNIDFARYLKLDLSPEQSVEQYLTGIYNATVQQMLQRFVNYNNNKLGIEATNQQFTICRNVAYEKVEQKGAFRGIYFKLENSHNLKALLQKISIQLDTPQDVKIYLYNLNKKQAISTQNITILDDYDKIFTDLQDFVIEYSNEYGQGLEFLLGYYEYNSDYPDNLQLNQNSQAYKIEEPIQLVDNIELNYMPVYVEKDKLVFDANINDFVCPAKINIMPTTISAGIDVAVKLECDYTELLLTYKLIFAELLQIMLAKRIISDCLYTNEFNTITESNRKNWNNLVIYFTNLIDGYKFTDENGKFSVKDGIISTILKQFEGIDDTCFPRQRKMML